MRRLRVKSATVTSDPETSCRTAAKVDLLVMTATAHFCSRAKPGRAVLTWSMLTSRQRGEMKRGSLKGTVPLFLGLAGFHSAHISLAKESYVPYRGWVEWCKTLSQKAQHKYRDHRARFHSPPSLQRSVSLYLTYMHTKETHPLAMEVRLKV